MQLIDFLDICEKVSVMELNRFYFKFKVVILRKMINKKLCFFFDKYVF